MTKTHLWPASFRGPSVTLIAGLAISACTTGPPPPPPLIAVPEAPPPITPGGGIYKIGEPYQVEGVWYYPREDAEYDETGIGSWYGEEFHGRITANGEIFDRNAISAAHPILPMPVNARVTNLENGRSLVVRINDRGPFVNGRVIDLSEKAAQLLGYREQGTARVRVTFLGLAELEGNGTLSVAAATPPDVAYAVPAAPTDIVASNALAPVAGAAIAPARPVEALPRPTAQQAQPTSVLPRVDGEVVQMAVAPAAGTYTSADALVLNPAPNAGGIPTQPVATQQQAFGAVEAVNPVAQFAASTEEEIYVQAGAFDDFTNANRVASRLAFAGARITRVEGEQNTVFRVRMGPFEDMETAESVLLRVQSAALPGVEGAVVRQAVLPLNEPIASGGALALNPIADAAPAPQPIAEAPPPQPPQQNYPLSSLPEPAPGVGQVFVPPPEEMDSPAEAAMRNPVPDAAPTEIPAIEAPPEPEQVALASGQSGTDTQVVQLPVSPGGKIYIQAGAFDDFTNANRVASRLAFAGARISQIERNGATLYRVRIGPFQDITTADAVLAQVQSAGHTDVEFVVE